MKWTANGIDGFCNGSDDICRSSNVKFRARNTHLPEHPALKLAQERAHVNLTAALTAPLAPTGLFGDLPPHGQLGVLGEAKGRHQRLA